jgi:hypothetical protein
VISEGRPGLPAPAFVFSGALLSLSSARRPAAARQQSFDEPKPTGRASSIELVPLKVTRDGRAAI